MFWFALLQEGAALAGPDFSARLVLALVSSSVLPLKKKSGSGGGTVMRLWRGRRGTGECADAGSAVCSLLPRQRRDTQVLDQGEDKHTSVLCV